LLAEIPTSTIKFSTEISTASTHAGWGLYTRFSFNSDTSGMVGKCLPAGMAYFV